MQAQRAPATFSHFAKQIIQMTPQVLTIDVLPYDACNSASQQETQGQSLFRINL